MKLRSAAVLLLFLLNALTAAAQSPVGEPAERRVFVPIEDLDVVLEQDKHGVLLSKAEFQKLVADAQKNAEEAKSTNHAVVITRAVYTAKIVDQQILVSATIELEQLQRGWRTVHMPYSGLAVEGATLDGKAAQIGRAGDDRALVLFVNQPGKHTLKFEFSGALVNIGSDQSAGFSIPPISPAVLQMTLPAGKNLHVNDAAPVRPAALDQPAEYSVPLGGLTAVSLRITDRRTQQETNSLVFAGSVIGLHVSPEERTWRALTSLNVFGKQIDNLTFTIPKTLEIVAVESSGLERWEIGDATEADSATVKLVYRQPIQDARTIVISGVSASEIGQPWYVPRLTLKSATSHLVKVLVQHPSGLRLNEVESSGIRRVSPEEANPAESAADLGSLVKPGGGKVHYYAAWQEDFSLGFVTQTRARELQSTTATRIDISSYEVNLRASIAVQTRFAPLFDFDLTLPVEWIVEDLTVDDRPAAWRLVNSAAEENRMRVAFNPPIPAGKTATLLLTARMIPTENMPINDQPVSISLPEVSLSNVGVTDGRYMIAVDSDLDLVAEETTGLVPARLSDAESAAENAPRLVYEYQEPKFTGKFRVTRKPVRVAVQTLEHHRLDRETVFSHLEAQLVVLGGGVQKLQISLPESTGVDLRFAIVPPPTNLQAQVPRITEQTAAPPANGRRIWTLQLDQRAFGLLWLAVDLTAQRQADVENYELPSLVVVDADRQNGFVAVEGGADQQLDISAVDSTGRPLAEVDPADVPAPARYTAKDRIVGAWRAIRVGSSVKVKETRFDRRAVPTAFCDRMLITSILGEGGQQQHKSEFDLRAVGVQSLQVSLPDGAVLWAASIAGKPVEVRREAAPKTGWLVPLPTLESGVSQVSVELFYRTNGGSLVQSGRLRQTPPRITAIGGDGTQEPLESLTREWRLHYPPQTEITASTGDFEPTEKLTRVSRLGRLHAAVSHISFNQVRVKFIPLGIVGIVVIAFSFAFRKRGVLGLVLLIGGGFVVVLGSLFLMLASQSYESAPGKYGNLSYRPDAAPEFQSSYKSADMEARDSDSDSAVRVVEAAPSRNISKQMGGPPGMPGGPGAPGGFGGRGMPGAPGGPGGPGGMPPPAAAAAMGGSLKTETSTGKKSDAAPASVDDDIFVPQQEVVQKDGAADLSEERFDTQKESDKAGMFPLGKSAGAKKGLLSLAIELPVPANSQATFFRYAGTPHVDSGAVLEIDYENRHSASASVLAWQAALLLLFWFARNWSKTMRVLLVVCGIFVPLALVAVVSIEILPYLDALFIGSIGGCALWFCLAAIPRMQAMIAELNKPASPTTGLLFVALLSLISATVARAEEAATNAAPKPAIPSIVVPYDSGQDPLQSGKVFLPWNKFLELWNAAHPEQAIGSSVPAEGFVAQALYATEIDATGKSALAKVSARFVIHSLVDEQTTIPLPLGVIALDLARLDGTAAAIVTRDIAGGSELAVVVPQSGIHILDLKFSLQIEQTGAAGKITLPSKPVASGTWQITLPEGDFNIRLTGGARTFRKLKENQRTVALVPVDQGGDMTLSWTPALVRDAVEGIVHVDSVSAYSLNDAGLRINTAFKYTVRQGTLGEVSYSLPAGILVRQITGLDLGGWEIAGDGEDRTLKVFLRRVVNDTTTVQFDLFSPQSFTEQPQAVTMPQVVPTGVTREIGTIGVFVEKQISAVAGAASGLSQIDLRQFVSPPPLVPPGATAGQQSPAATVPILAYRFAARPVQLQLQASRQKPQSKATAEHAVVIGARKQKIVSRIQLQLAGAPRSEIVVDLPPGFILYDLKSNDVADYHVELRPGWPNATLVAELPAPRTGIVAFEIVGIVPREVDDLATQVAVPAPLELDDLRTSTAVWLDRIYTATLEELSGWKSIDPATLPDQLRSAHATPAQLAFSANLTGLQPIFLTLQRAVSRLSAESLSVVIARDTSVQHLMYLRWQIAAAGENSFVFTTPDWLADRLTFDRETTGVRIRQVVSEKIAGNRVRWIVTLDDLKTNVSTLIAQATLPPADAARISPAVPIFERPAVGGEAKYESLDQQSQYVVLVNQSPHRLDQITPDAVLALPAVDLPIKLTETISDQAAEILRIRDPRADIGWTVQTAQQHKSSAASVNLAKMTLVVAQDGSWRGLAHYRINNRSRQFLALRMPEKTRILSLFVAKQPARPINPKRSGDPNLVLIPLPKTAEGDLSAEVKLVYAGRLEGALPKGMQIFKSEVDLPAPQVLSQSDDPDFGIPVAATEWTVIVPEGIDAQLIDDPQRSNVAESDLGIEEKIAIYNEWLSLSKIVLDDDYSSSAAQSRAKNNLKQIGMALSSGPNSLEQSKDARQNAELEKLNQQMQTVKAKLKSQETIQQSPNVHRRMFDGLSNEAVQRELASNNPADFERQHSVDDDLEKDILKDLDKSTPQPPDAGKNAASQSQSRRKSSGANRDELRRQTASQSMALNNSINAPGKSDEQSADKSRGSNQARLKANLGDADQVFEQSNSSVAKTGKAMSSLASDANGQQKPTSGMQGAFGGGFGAAMGGQGGEQAGEALNGQASDIAGGRSELYTLGGLSLDLDIPQNGRKLTFAKSGGDARLALGLRPQSSYEIGLGMIWALVWIGLAIGVIVSLAQANPVEIVIRHFPKLMTLCGAALFLFMPDAVIGFVIFLCGAIVWGWSYCQRAPRRQN